MTLAPPSPRRSPPRRGSRGHQASRPGRGRYGQATTPPSPVRMTGRPARSRQLGGDRLDGIEARVVASVLEGWYGRALGARGRALIHLHPWSGSPRWWAAGKPMGPEPKGMIEAGTHSGEGRQSSKACLSDTTRSWTGRVWVVAGPKVRVMSPNRVQRGRQIESRNKPIRSPGDRTRKGLGRSGCSARSGVQDVSRGHSGAARPVLDTRHGRKDQLDRGLTTATPAGGPCGSPRPSSSTCL